MTSVAASREVEIAPECPAADREGRHIFEKRVKYRMRNHGAVVIKNAVDPELCKDLAVDVFKNCCRNF